MIYLYGLVEAPSARVAEAITGLPGLQNPTQVVALDHGTLVVSDQDSEEILPRRRLMLAHTRVLEKLLPLGPVLPARFGIVTTDVGEATALIKAHANSIAAAFDQIRGAAEISIRVHVPREVALNATLASDPALAARRDALAQKQSAGHFEIAHFGETLADQLDRRRGAAQATLLAALRPLARSHVLQTPDTDTVILRAAFLVDEARLADFEDTLQSTFAGLTFAPGADPTIQIIGPAPAYNFVRLNLTQDTEETAA